LIGWTHLSLSSEFVRWQSMPQIPVGPGDLLCRVAKLYSLRWDNVPGNWPGAEKLSRAYQDAEQTQGTTVSGLSMRKVSAIWH